MPSATTPVPAPRSCSATSRCPRPFDRVPPCHSERTRAYLESPTPLRQIWLDLQALDTWRDRSTLVREHLFPPASYVNASTTSRTPLAWAYATRLFVARGTGWIGWCARQLLHS